MKRARKTCSSQIQWGSRIHTKIFLTLARRTCGRACERHLHLADKSLDEAVKRARSGHCMTMKGVLRRAERHVAQARKSS